MIRFCVVKAACEQPQGQDHLTFNSRIWEQGRQYFTSHCDVTSVPVLDAAGRPVCIAWQDETANQELRMLDELIHTEGAVQFEAYYPQYDGVIIHGCSELSYQLAKYLQSRGVPAALNGPFWEFLDISGTEGAVFSRPLEIFAEGTWEHSGEPWLEAVRTVSVEFDCIYKLYMENVRAGNICNAAKSVNQVMKLFHEHDVILLGTDAAAQDAYDFLAGNGIEIAGFLGKERDREGMKLLGKEILVYNDLSRFESPVLVDCRNENGVLGGEADWYAYRGFRRNENYFYLKDYVEVPETKLTYVLKHFTVVLIGDELLCRRLRRFLVKIGKAEHEILSYDEVGEADGAQAGRLGIPVVLQNFNTMGAYRWEQQILKCKRCLREKGITYYTDYFAFFEAFIGMDLNRQKFLPQELKPKGILLGCFNSASGNIFSRECMDSHPNILHLGFTFLETHLFQYCIRLEEVKKEDIARIFWTLITPELGSRFAEIFPDRELFDLAFKELLQKTGKYPTSQELFVAICAAYSKMMGRAVSNISDYYIFWEPHYISRNRMRRYAEWLNEAHLGGFIVYGKRDAVTVRGSLLKYFDLEYYSIEIIDNSNRNLIKIVLDTADITVSHAPIPHWGALVLRFEDLKLRPRETWGKFCGALGIPWSDTLLETTKWGKSSAFRINSSSSGISGYDLKPVYNTYAQYFSALDQLRLRICNADFQREFGYPYVSCLRFSRKELQELFLKDFQIEQRLRFQDSQDMTEYYLSRAAWIQEYLKTLYNRSVFRQAQEDADEEQYIEEDEKVQKLRQYGIAEHRGKAQAATEMHPRVKELLADILSVLNREDRVVLYGLGDDAKWLLRNLNGSIKKKLVFCDKKARNRPITYLGKTVITPDKLISDYRDCYIIVAPHSCWETIESELNEMGVEKSRVISNKLPLYLMGSWDLNPVESMKDQVLGEWI